MVDVPSLTPTFMELPDGRFARRRINRCRRGSTNWLWYRAVLAEHGRRQLGTEIELLAEAFP